MSSTAILAFSGGVGGAKLALGLTRVLAPERLTIVVNTGDDEEFYGLHVAPDLDTVMYTLAGVVNAETGWGVAGETFHSLDMFEVLRRTNLVSIGGQRSRDSHSSETATRRRPHAIRSD